MVWGPRSLSRGKVAVPAAKARRGYSETATGRSAQVVLQRAAGTKWRAAGAKLPGPLIALAADAGSGFVGLGPTEAKKGVRVATVFEDPSIAPPEHPPALFRTHTAQLWLKGTGFVRAGQLVAGAFSRASISRSSSSRAHWRNG